MSESRELTLTRRALDGLRVVRAAEGLRVALDRIGDEDPAALVLADLMVRHAEKAERAAMALRLRLHRMYAQRDAKWGES